MNDIIIKKFEGGITIDNMRVNCIYDEEKLEITIFDGIKYINLIKELFYSMKPFFIILPNEIKRKIVLSKFNIAKHHVEGDNFYIFVDFKILHEISFSDLPAKH